MLSWPPRSLASTPPTRAPAPCRHRAGGCPRGPHNESCVAVGARRRLETGHGGPMADFRRPSLSYCPYEPEYLMFESYSTYQCHKPLFAIPSPLPFKALTLNLSARTWQEAGHLALSILGTKTIRCGSLSITRPVHFIAMEQGRGGGTPPAIQQPWPRQQEAMQPQQFAEVSWAACVGSIDCRFSPSLVQSGLSWLSCRWPAKSISWTMEGDPPVMQLAASCTTCVDVAPIQCRRSRARRQ